MTYRWRNTASRNDEFVDMRKNRENGEFVDTRKNRENGEYCRRYNFKGFIRIKATLLAAANAASLEFL